MKTKLYWSLAIIAFFIILPPLLQNVTAIDNPDYIEVIEPGYYLYYTRDLKKGDIAEVEFNVIAGGNLDIDFFIADETNYLLWHNGLDALVYGLHERYQYAHITFNAPKADTYYIIFSNTFSIITAKTVQINLDVRSGFLSLITSPIGIIIIIAIVGVVLFFIIRATKKKPSPSPTYPPQQYPFPTTQSANMTPSPLNQSTSFPSSIPFFCNKCGAPQPTGSVFCSRCGSKLN